MAPAPADPICLAPDKATVREEGVKGFDMISIGDRLPEADLLVIGPQGPEAVRLSDYTKGKRVVLFGLPGAFTATCTAAHVPSFIRTADQFRAKGIDHIICFAVNDPHVMRAWGEATGGTEAGIVFLADADGSLTKALGLDFDAPAAGFFGRTRRHAMIATDGVVDVLHVEQARGVCELTAGENLLRDI